jgi:NADH dehydrogenase
MPDAHTAVSSVRKKTVLILGAGFGGLRTAILLGKKLRRMRLADRYDVVLMDRNEHHTYTPLLYEVATTSKQTANIHELHNIATYNIRASLAGLPVRFLQAEVASVEPETGTVHLYTCPMGKRDSTETTLSSDHLVFALGSDVNYFDVPGLRDHAMPIKTMKDALQIRDHISILAMEGKRDIRIVIGGGGPTGVELAGELKAWCGELTDEFRCQLEVTLVQSAPTILPGFPPGIIRRATERLKRFGVRIMENRRIANVDERELSLQSGETVPYDVLVWAGGVKASPLLATMKLKTEPRGRAEVNAHMQCAAAFPDARLRGKVYALGDSACFYHPKTKAPVPGVARAALSQAAVVAHNIAEDVKAEQGLGAPRYTVFRPWNYPYITPVGGKYAIASIGPFVVPGFFGWVFKGLVELNYLFSILPFGRAVIVWITGLHVFMQNDRLG